MLLDISITFRTLNFYSNSSESDNLNEFVQESFQYVIREYYVIIWSFLFKNDYAFKVLNKILSLKNHSFSYVLIFRLNKKVKHL